jgi:hypothetical protein
MVSVIEAAFLVVVAVVAEGEAASARPKRSARRVWSARQVG